MGHSDADYHSLGKVLFQIAAKISGSRSDVSGDGYEGPGFFPGDWGGPGVFPGDWGLPGVLVMGVSPDTLMLSVSPPISQAAALPGPLSRGSVFQPDPRSTTKRWGFYGDQAALVPPVHRLSPKVQALGSSGFPRTCAPTPTRRAYRTGSTATSKPASTCLLLDRVTARRSTPIVAAP